jgi:HAD superfamily hydrolase (TIGR01662 family)
LDCSPGNGKAVVARATCCYGANDGRPALFIDRDGTLVHARHYPSQPEELLLYEGVGAAIAPLQRAGLLLVVITNQSGLARGLFDEAALGHRAQVYGWLRIAR